jgi:hypothetical protein
MVRVLEATGLIVSVSGRPSGSSENVVVLVQALPELGANRRGKRTGSFPTYFTRLAINEGLRLDTDRGATVLQEGTVRAVMKALLGGGFVQGAHKDEANRIALGDGAAFLAALRERAARGDGAASEVLAVLARPAAELRISALLFAEGSPRALSCGAAALVAVPRAASYEFSPGYWALAAIAAELADRGLAVEERGAGQAGRDLLTEYVVAHFPYGAMDRSDRWTLPTRAILAAADAARDRAVAGRDAFVSVCDAMDACVADDPQIRAAEDAVAWNVAAGRGGFGQRGMATHKEHHDKTDVSVGGRLGVDFRRRLEEELGADGLASVLDLAREHVIRVACAGKGIVPASREEVVEAMARMAVHPAFAEALAGVSYPHRPEILNENDPASVRSWLVGQSWALARAWERSLTNAAFNGRLQCEFGSLEAAVSAVCSRWRNGSQRSNPSDLLLATYTESYAGTRLLAFADRANEMERGGIEAINRVGCSGDAESFASLASAMRESLAAWRARFPADGTATLDAIDGWERAHARVHLACSPADHPGASAEAHYGPHAAADALASYRDALAALPVPMRAAFRDATVRMVASNAPHVSNTVAMASRMGNGLVAARGAMLLADFVAWGAAGLSKDSRKAVDADAEAMRRAASAVIAASGQPAGFDGRMPYDVTVVENSLGPGEPGFYYRIAGLEESIGPYPSEPAAAAAAEMGVAEEAALADAELKVAREALVRAEARDADARTRVAALAAASASPGEFDWFPVGRFK